MCKEVLTCQKDSVHMHSNSSEVNKNPYHARSSSIKIAFLLNFSFAIIEAIGALLTNSTAIMSDAVHDLGDCLALAISYIFEKLSHQAPNDKYNFGLKRLALVGAMINIFVLCLGTFFVFMSAVHALMYPEFVRAEGMMLLGVLGILVNGISVYRMKNLKNVLDKSVVIHLMEDLIGWTGVLIGGMIIYLTQWFFIDTMLTFIITLINLNNIKRNSKNVYQIIMQANPDIQLYEELKVKLLEIEGVKELMQFEFWSLDGESHVLTATVAIEYEYNRDVILSEIKYKLIQYELNHSTIELIQSRKERT